MLIADTDQKQVRYNKALHPTPVLPDSHLQANIPAQVSLAVIPQAKVILFRGEDEPCE